MRLRKVIFAFIICCAGIRFSFSQQESDRRIFDLIALPTNCEMIVISIENLISELEKQPDSIAYIVIDPPRKKSKLLDMGGFLYEDIISEQLKSKKWYQANQSRVRLVRGDSEKYKIEILIVANDSVKPTLKQAKWDFTIPSEPVLFDENYGGQLCAETPFRLNAFAEILRAYPRARGHFVIYAASFKDFPEAKEFIVNNINRVGMPIDRFKFFFKKDSSAKYPHAKLWLIPKQ